MKMNSSQFLDQLANEQVVMNTTGVILADFSKDPAKLIQPALAFVAEQINTGHLAQARIVVEKTEIEFKIETSIINLPLRYAKTIQKVVQDDQEYPVNVYMIIESPDVNRSKLRIDEVATTDEVAADPQQFATGITKWVQQHLAQIKQNQADKQAEEEAAVKKPATKTTTKKRTTKKSAVKK